MCGRAYLLLQRKLPGLHLVLVCGPRIAPESLHVPTGIDVRGFVPDLYKHLAAADLAVVQGGGTTTLELTALRRPFIYFPLEGHCEQQVTVAGRLARQRAGVKMAFPATTPASLADAITRHLAAAVSYPPYRSAARTGWRTSSSGMPEPPQQARRAGLPRSPG